MACSSCGKPRVQMSQNRAGIPPRSSSTANSLRTVDSQSVGTKVNGAVASNPNAAKRTKV